MEDPVTATTKGLPLIDADQQVRHLEDRGVRFELTDEREAERFLRESNFFFKVKAFAKCFSRYTSPGSERFGSYINLDFAHLAELTRLDHHLCETVLSLTLNIGHYMKVDLNRMVMDPGGDPYGLMASFFDSERERKLKVPCRTSPQLTLIRSSRAAQKRWFRVQRAPRLKRQAQSHLPRRPFPQTQPRADRIEQAA